MVVLPVTLDDAVRMTTGGGGRDGLVLACSRSCCTVVLDYGVVNVVLVD